MFFIYFVYFKINFLEKKSQSFYNILWGNI